MPNPFRTGALRLLALAGVCLLGASAPALAVNPGSADIRATADCNTNANLDLSWTAAGNHYEYGAAYDASGTVIGTFGPESSANNDWSGPYLIPITTAQSANALIGAYAWVGSNPPTQATAVEYFVVYNCSTRAVLYRCSSTYGSCANSVAEALASLASAGPPLRVPATSGEMLALMSLVLAAIGGVFARRVKR